MASLEDRVADLEAKIEQMRMFDRTQAFLEGQLFTLRVVFMKLVVRTVPELYPFARAKAFSITHVDELQALIEDFELADKKYERHEIVGAPVESDPFLKDDPRLENILERYEIAWRAASRLHFVRIILLAAIRAQYPSLSEFAKTALTQNEQEERRKSATELNEQADIYDNLFAHLMLVNDEHLAHQFLEQFTASSS